MATEDAPGELELVRTFVNTADPDTGEDELASRAGLAAWLAERELLEPGERLSEGDRQRATRFRETLRLLLLANNGAPLPARAIEEINEAISGARLVVRFSGEGSAELIPAGRGVESAIARLAAIVAESMADGTWARLKACRSEDCQWAFYDRSRNRSGAWCDMAVCGNRAKVRSYRKRRGRRR